MKKIKIRLIILSILLVLAVIPLNTNNKPISTQESKEKDSITELKISTTSGGGYIIDTEASYSWIDITTTGFLMPIISEGDSDSESIPLLWNFTFYETNYTTIYVSSNGWMSFINDDPTSSWGEIPGYGEKNDDTVALLWSDLNTEDLEGGGSVYYEFLAAPNRLVIEYYEVYTDDSPSKEAGTFEVIFYETGDIKFQYHHVYNLEDDDATVGLDHGDGVNYNVYTGINVSSLPFNAKAISFQYDKMIKVNYSLGFDIDDEFSWIVNDINNSIMEIFFGSNWETDFGVFIDPDRFDKTKINISSINDNSTHWEINYTLWDWINKDYNFNPTGDRQETIIYRQEPLNYTQKHNLTNVFPFFIPKPNALYLHRANLSNIYDRIDYNSWDGSVEFEYSRDKLINGHWIDMDGKAEYNKGGLLQKLILEWENETTGEEGIAYEIYLFFDGPKPSYVGINKGESYEFGVFYSVNNAPQDYFEDWEDEIPNRFKIGIEFISGHNPYNNGTLVIVNYSEYFEGQWNDIEYYAITILNGTANVGGGFYSPYVDCVFSDANTNWDQYATLMQQFYDLYYPEYNMIFVSLGNGIKFETPNSEFIITFSSNGVLNIMSQNFNGKEYYTIRYNVFDYEIYEGDDDDDDDEVLGIPGANLVIISLIILVGITSIVWQFKKKSLAKGRRVLTS